MAVTREIAKAEQERRIKPALFAEPADLAVERMEAAFQHAAEVASDPKGLVPAYAAVIEKNRQAALAERSDTHQISEDHVTYKNPVCRGSLALGSACKHCEKCLAEFDALRGFGVGEVPAKDISGDTPIQSLVDRNIAADLRYVPLDVRDIKATLPRDVNKPPFPGDAPVAGLPNKGYRLTQPTWKVALVDQNKDLEELMLRQIDKIAGMADIDGRQLALARTKLEEAYYHLNKAIYQPKGSRFSGPLDLSGFEKLSS